MKRIVSGITPSGDGTLHIGNYLGAVRQFIETARDNECYLFVADYHALTTIQDRQKLSGNIGNLIRNELALLMGLGSMQNVTFFRQSDVPLHTELQTIISNVTPLGLLKRAHAYKDKLEKDVMEDDINAGLFNYPVLMAADILMYKPDLVPVGKDQKQHIEIARDIAERFNRTYNTKLFKLPDGYIPDHVATVLGTDGKRKMSKSIGNIISIFEDEAVVRKQVMGCYTDPTRTKATDPGHIEGNMVFAYLDLFGKPDRVAQLKQLYTAGNIPDVEVKEELYAAIMDTFAPAREKFRELSDNPRLVTNILREGAEKAMATAAETMAEVRTYIGLTTPYSFYSYPKQKPEGAPVTIEEFGAVQLRVGRVDQAVNVEKSEKLIRLSVDFGEGGKRVIFTGVRGYGYTASDFEGKQFFFVYNLQPRKMMGEQSQGMILAVDGTEKPFGEHGDAKPIFVSAEGMPVGSLIR